MQLNDLYAATLHRLSQIEEEKATLLIKKTTLEELGAGKPTQLLKPSPPSKASQKALPASPAKAKKKGRKRQRAPFGTLKNALLEAIGDGALTNAEVRNKLKSSGYSYPMGQMHVRKNLKKLAKDGSLKTTMDGTALRYSLPKSI
jgi:hypothetical protein